VDVIPYNPNALIKAICQHKSTLVVLDVDADIEWPLPFSRAKIGPYGLDRNRDGPLDLYEEIPWLDFVASLWMNDGFPGGDSSDGHSEL
jgi:hypothetical protein